MYSIQIATSFQVFVIELKVVETPALLMDTSKKLSFSWLLQAYL